LALQRDNGLDAFAREELLVAFFSAAFVFVSEHASETIVRVLSRYQLSISL
jgi:hypothetical protein